MAFFLCVAIAWYVGRTFDKQAVRGRKPALYDEDQVREAIMHARQDLKLLAFLLGAVVIMLGIVADRLH